MTVWIFLCFPWHYINLFSVKKIQQNKHLIPLTQNASLMDKNKKQNNQPVRLTGEYDIGQSSAAVGVQHVGPHVQRLLQAAVAATQPWERSLGVVERGGGRVEAGAPCCGAHGVFQQSELVQLVGRWRRENGKWKKSVRRVVVAISLAA